ncbi:hypothetical protein KO504_12715 [Winogradskyella psychrotolerans]|uniref:hypothetical protein n=1 Tax=Winogradskyella psychrotolerans TaxID=1344585 RepID=UPI001C06FAAB|nr:hypothetical protein [Winogradskyella psychrotolerans]MBU2922208.1 hypothetical protein [Winogradskyella psychrotolerans]
MNRKATFGLILIIFFAYLSYGQTERDIIINDSIYPIIHESENYQNVKNKIFELEKIYGYEAELKYSLINYSYQYNDIEFFKTELTKLVKNYGFQLIYLNGRESYYKSITKGELAEWFKEMYLKNHFFWLKNNFDKQIDLKKLNDIKEKDQLINKYTRQIWNELELDSTQKAKQNNLISDFYFTNIAELYEITKKNSNYPNSKNFALVQNNLYVAEIHNLQAKSNFKRYWTLFYSYFKKAYLNNEITYAIFKSYDQMSFVHFGNQRFGLLEINKIPEIYKKENLTEVPIVDLEFYWKIKNEFNWK